MRVDAFASAVRTDRDCLGVAARQLRELAREQLLSPEGRAYYAATSTAHNYEDIVRSAAQGVL